MTPHRPSAHGRPVIRFSCHIGIDYSGAETPTASLKTLRVYEAQGGGEPAEVPPPPSSKKYWTRRDIAEWLLARLSSGEPTLVGIDHGFSFPLAYFDAHRLPHEWPAFLDDFVRHWPTDQDNVYVDFVRDGALGNGAARAGNARWRRLTERRAGAARSVFQFDGPGSGAKSTHAGLPWLWRLRQQLAGRVHVWPFDGWDPPIGRSVVAEVYPVLWSRSILRRDRTSDQPDACVVASALSAADRDGKLGTWFHPALTDIERRTAEIEGWILGVA